MDGPPRLAGAWTAKVITLFPEAFPGVLGLSLTGRPSIRASGRWSRSTCAPSARAGIAMSMTRRRAAGRAWCCAPT
jgi:hypothetical protein